MKNPDLALGSELKFYNGEVTLRFSEKNHAYYEIVDGVPELRAGVTQTCHIIDHSVYLMPWVAKMMETKLLRTMPHETDDFTGVKSVLPISWDEFAELVRQSKAAHKEILTDASDVGAEAHSWLEDSIRWAITFNGGIVKELTDKVPNDERAINCGHAALDWMKSRHVRWVKTESVVFSRKWKYAGTLDGLAYVNDVLSIVDWKSSNALRTDYCLQTAAYLKAAEEENGVPIPDRHILRLGKEKGEFEPWHLGPETIETDFDAFILCLHLRNTYDKIESRIAEYKKSQTAAKKAAKKEKNAKS